jgi:DNA-binding YbaB/EbfC family protein
MGKKLRKGQRMKGMDDLLRQAELMKERIAGIQHSLAGKTVEGSSGGAMVRVVATGKQEIVSVLIEKTVIDPGEGEMLQDLVTAAVNDALCRSRSLAEQEMASLTGGFSIPGLTLP